MYNITDKITKVFYFYYSILNGMSIMDCSMWESWWTFVPMWTMVGQDMFPGGSALRLGLGLITSVPGCPGPISWRVKVMWRREKKCLNRLRIWFVLVRFDSSSPPPVKFPKKSLFETIFYLNFFFFFFYFGLGRVDYLNLT